jgi:hypothetical protein
MFKAATEEGETWYGECSPTSMPTFMSWLTATQRTRPQASVAMISRLIEDRLDTVIAARVPKKAGAYRPGHQMGNRLLTHFFAVTFNATFIDILSGYRVFSRRFVNSFPVLSSGFEIETELSAHALELDLAVGEVPPPYYARPKGSASKLSTWRDGLRTSGPLSGSTVRSGRCAFSASSAPCWRLCRSCSQFRSSLPFSGKAH